MKRDLHAYPWCSIFITLYLLNEREKWERVQNNWNLIVFIALKPVLFWCHKNKTFKIHARYHSKEGTGNIVWYCSYLLLTLIILLLIRVKRKCEIASFLYFLAKNKFSLKIIKKIPSMPKYIQFYIFISKRYILLYDYEFYYRLES